MDSSIEGERSTYLVALNNTRIGHSEQNHRTDEEREQKTDRLHIEGESRGKCWYGEKWVCDLEQAAEKETGPEGWVTVFSFDWMRKDLLYVQIEL